MLGCDSLQISVRNSLSIQNQIVGQTVIQLDHSHTIHQTYLQNIKNAVHDISTKTLEGLGIKNIHEYHFDAFQHAVRDAEVLGTNEQSRASGSHV